MELYINELLNFSPLMKTFTFNAWVVAGFTPITRGSKLDYYINRPQGMKGYIINLTLRGQARAKAGDGSLLCRENDLLLFPPGVPHHYGRDEHSEYWDHLWIYFIPRPYWIDWLKWDQTTHGIGKTTVNDPEQLQSLKNELGQTVYAWREAQRINRARWLIQSTSLPLNKIALSVGYGDPVYFTRIFRKHNGIPPGEYRKRYAEMKG